MLNKNNIP